MIVRWPGKIKEGSVTHHAAANWDFFPTAAEMTGTAPPEGIDGVSYLPTLLGNRQIDNEYLYWEFERGKATHQAVRMGNWKGIRHGAAAPLELYDLSKDIGETNDIAADHPDIVRRIETAMKDARTESEFWEFL